MVVFLINYGCDKNSGEAFCRISPGINTDQFVQGCILPIRVEAGEGGNTEVQVELLINGQSQGLVPSFPNLFYWESAGTSTGEIFLEAIYLSSDNSILTDKYTIILQPVTMSCPKELTDIDGNNYSVVQIGNQCWMGENLKVRHYPDGKTLVNGSDSLETISNDPFGFQTREFTGWYFSFNGDPAYGEKYGFLYDWKTTMNGEQASNQSSESIQGICPDGWHVPDVDEWKQMINFNGGVKIAANKLKEKGDQHWVKNLSEVDNASSFTALPGGCFVPVKSFLNAGTEAYFWSGTETIPNHAYHIYLKSKDPKAFILGHQDSKRFGYSVRCVKD